MRSLLVVQPPIHEFLESDHSISVGVYRRELQRQDFIL